MQILAKCIQDFIIAAVVVMALMTSTITYSTAKATESVIERILSDPGDRVASSKPPSDTDLAVYYEEPEDEEIRYYSRE